jgi:anaerobic selenocysteine-containing dehydrogenase
MYSKTIADWGWPDQALPDYQRSHVHWRELEDGQMVLLPTFRLPTLIHTRSGNAKWLQEISHTNPLWIHPEDAERLDVKTGKLVRIETAIGWFVLRGWITEGIHPGVVACSHHAGRWRTSPDSGGERSSSSLVGIERKGSTFLFRQRTGATAFSSEDPDSARIWWQEIGVNQNLAFPVQPDPQSGMHCWHQKVKVARAQPGDRYGDILVDTSRSREVFEQWLAMTRPAPGPDGTRRPGWLNRPMHPKPECYRLE